MAFGHGKYGAHAEKLLRDVGGDLCIIILNGPRGVGFDVATSNLALLRVIPDVLRRTADNIEADLASGKGTP